MPYPDPRVAIATLHGKAEALRPALARVGLVPVTVAVDTDAFGTFSGEIERRADPRETAIAKARLGMTTSGLPLGLATEGSFGPDPLLGFLPAHHELLAFVDDTHGQVLVLEQTGRDSNWQSKTLRHADEAWPLLQASGFPEHAVLVRPNLFQPGMPVAKGLRDPAAVAAAIAHAAALSADGLARLDTDMRAHMNPTRMRRIAALGEALAQRLATPCPACGTPGFGLTGTEPGLPCELCGEATDLVRDEIHGCGVCGVRETRPRADGRTAADAGHCPECNP
ncbi:DUF6671 family protein [Silanimonas sp.]|uniref:DUF6671 family protein n=1 Tax=Silanimonas sp. TaxID=1929290 RepID=UPI001BB85FC9|nr:DUF6671 family protein [Silanimonas sp.]MBS3896542.1 hypothetical protein [Silanimonas sp.]